MLPWSLHGAGFKQREVCKCILAQDDGGDDIVMHDADCSFLDSPSESPDVGQSNKTLNPTVRCAPPSISSPETCDLDSRIKLIKRKNILWLARFQDVEDDKRQAAQRAAAQRAAALPHKSVHLVATSQPRLGNAPQSARTTVKAKSHNWEKITITVVNEEAQESSFWRHSTPKKMEDRLGGRLRGRLGEEPVVNRAEEKQLITCTISNCQDMEKDKRQAAQRAAALPHKSVHLVATSQPRLGNAPQSVRTTVKAKSHNWEKITITVINEEAQESSFWRHSTPKKMEDRLGGRLRGRLGEEPVVNRAEEKQLITCTISNCQEATGYITDMSQSTSEAERQEYLHWKKRNRFYRLP